MVCPAKKLINVGFIYVRKHILFILFIYLTKARIHVFFVFLAHPVIGYTGLTAAAAAAV